MCIHIAQIISHIIKGRSNSTKDIKLFNLRDCRLVLNAACHNVCKGQYEIYNCLFHLIIAEASMCKLNWEVELMKIISIQYSMSKLLSTM